EGVAEAVAHAERDDVALACPEDSPRQYLFARRVVDVVLDVERVLQRVVGPTAVRPLPLRLLGSQRIPLIAGAADPTHQEALRRQWVARRWVELDAFVARDVVDERRSEER